MQVEIGQVYEGQVKSITSYGAFVEMTTEDSAQPVTGMVHISEIANGFVRDIHDFLKENDAVKVVVLGINEQGKISLSIKQALPQSEKPVRKKHRDNPPPRIYEPKRAVPQSEMSFEDMLLHFKQCSEENICALKRGSERKGGSRSRK